jgi:hypothetical protein
MFRDFLTEFVPLMLIVFVLAFTVFIALQNTLGRYECGVYREQTSRETKFHWITGCYIRGYDNNWYEAEEFRNLIIAKEGLNND